MYRESNVFGGAQHSPIWDTGGMQQHKKTLYKSVEKDLADQINRKKKNKDTGREKLF